MSAPGARAVSIVLPCLDDRELLTTHLPPLLAEIDRRGAGDEILVVDDNATNRLVADAFLKALGYESDSACDGVEAIEMLTPGRYTLVLLDMHMPRMDGKETLAAIRALDGETANIPVIALTADLTSGQEDYYLSIGMDGFVQKPIDRMSLQAAIDRVISQRRGADQAANAA